MATVKSIKQVEIGKLKPYENNAKQHPQSQIDLIARSIEEYGFLNPCLIDKDYNVIAGHGRIKAATKLGLETVPCLFVEGLTEAQYKAYVLADNRLTELGEWNMDLVILELEALQDMDFDISLTGFDMPEIEVETEDIVEDDVPEEVETRCKLGDIWKLGDHRLICGDSTDVGVLDSLIEGDKVDIIFTDPPYGMNLDTDYSDMKNHLDFAKEKGFTGGKKYDRGKVDDFCPEMVDTVISIDAKEIFLWGADYYAELIPDRDKGSWFVWDKRANGDGDDEADYSSDKMFGSCFELCWSKQKHKRDIARVKWAGVFGTEQEFDHKRWHPTQKPAKLAAWFLGRFSEAGDKVLDIFGGSGSTLIACEQLGRKCFMCEFDEHYCDVIIQRWENLTGKEAERIN